MDSAVVTTNPGQSAYTSLDHDHDRHSDRWGRFTAQEVENFGRYNARSHSDLLSEIKETKYDLARVSDRLEKDLREAIRCEGDKTRALIEANEKERLRERAARAENAIQSYFTRNVPPIVPTA